MAAVVQETGSGDTIPMEDDSPSQPSTKPPVWVERCSVLISLYRTNMSRLPRGPFVATTFSCVHFIPSSGTHDVSSCCN
jgi:hypothetical protein